jgi:hypothetical protein
MAEVNSTFSFSRSFFAAPIFETSSPQNKKAALIAQSGLL